MTAAVTRSTTSVGSESVADVRAVRQAVVPGCAFSARIPSALSAVVLAARHSRVDGSSPSGAGALGPRVGTVVAVVVL